jgi:hypothetical protein
MLTNILCGAVIQHDWYFWREPRYGREVGGPMTTYAECQRCGATRVDWEPEGMVVHDTDPTLAYLLRVLGIEST